MSHSTRTMSARGRHVWVLFSLALLLSVVGLVAAYYPHDVDAPATAPELEQSRKYYADAFQQSTTTQQPDSDYDTKYLQVGTAVAANEHIQEQVQSFADRYGLRQKSVLDIGSGRGYLQDVVEDYTGLDISASVSRFYHKKFVLASATAMPFPDNSFDGAWSIWVLEHVPNPEQALRECRRVIRNGGVILLYPAWNCTSWAANGYDVRKYSDLDLAGKLIKASVPLRSSTLFKAATRVPNRIIRDIASRFGGPTTLHYHRLTPNYKEYWEADSDAVNSIDRHEVMIWFRSRGDECLNCAGSGGSVFSRGGFVPLIIRIHKQS